MKDKNRAPLFVLALVFAAVFGGCDMTNPVIDEWWHGSPPIEIDNGYPFTQETFVVAFDSGGGNYVDSINGNSPSVSPQRVWAHAYASVPGLVAKANNYFKGWYDAQASGNEWDFSGDPVVRDMTLYAQWESSGYRIDFDVNFPVSGYDVKADLTYTPESEYIADGAFAAEPLQFGLRRGTAYAGKYVFIGWRKTAVGTYDWVFDTDKADPANDGFGGAPVDRIITLYAEWAEILNPADVYTVQFDSKADINPPPEQYVMSGGLVIAPYVAFRSGYSFGGWYKDASCNDDWVFGADQADLANDAMDGAADNIIKLYAKWAPVDPVDVLKDLDIVDFRYILFSGGQTAYNAPAAAGSSTSLGADEKTANDGEIAKIAEWLNKYPNYRVMIVGHANPASDADKADPQNAELMALSQGRAKAVEAALKPALTQYDLNKTPIIVRAEGGRRAMRNPMLSRRVEIIVFDIITEEIAP